MPSLAPAVLGVRARRLTETWAALAEAAAGAIVKAAAGAIVKAAGPAGHKLLRLAPIIHLIGTRGTVQPLPATQ
jgi:hypothetical protein